MKDAYTIFKRIAEDENYLITYLEPAVRQHILSNQVTYSGGVVSFGVQSHPFTNVEYIALFSLLWPYRKIINADS